MKKRLLISAAICLCIWTAGAQDWSPIDSLLTRYYEVLEMEDMDSKMSECDWIIGQCRDSATRQHVAVSIYGHYVDSRVMGEEAVAIHIHDKWFATDSIPMYNDMDRLNADIFADFNRSTLIGSPAPVLTMKDIRGRKVSFPASGRTTILMFYDTSCPTCQAESVLLPSVIENIDFSVDFCCICTGSDRKAWKRYVREHLTFSNRNVRMFHVWDPEIESDFQRLYGVLSTPRTYVVEPQGTVIGRRLQPDSLAQILVYASAIQKQYDRLINNK